jgi:hypothetical protein
MFRLKKTFAFYNGIPKNGHLQHNNIHGVRLSGGVGWCWSSFPSIRPVIRPSKFLIPEEEDDGRVYYYKKIGVRVLMQLFLIGWSPPSPHPLRAPAKVSGWWGGWWDGQHSGNQGKLKNILL